MLNVETARSGYIKVELADNCGNVFSGRVFEDCDPINGDKARIKVTWKDESGLNAAGSQPVMLRFRLKAAKIYSFQVE